MAAQAQTQAAAHEAQMQVQEQGPDISGLLTSIVDETAKMRRDRVVLDMAIFAHRQRLAKMFVASGFFESQKDREKIPYDQAIAQAMVRIELGASMGFTEAESMQGIDIIQGRPAISAQLRASKMQEIGYSWTIKWHTTPKGECCGITLYLYKDGQKLLDEEGKHVAVNYSESDAQAMLTTIWENGNKKRVSILEKDNWKMSPRNMYFARAISNAQRWYAPAALKGVQILTREEAQDLDAIAEETERQRSEGPVVLQAPKLKPTAPEPKPAAPIESPAAQDLGFASDLDPNATVTDERAEEVKEAMNAAGWNRKQAEKLWADLKVNNAYGLTNEKADLALATIAGKEKVQPA